MLAIAICLMLGLGTHLIVIDQREQVDQAGRRDLSLFQIGWRWFYRILTLDRLAQFKIELILAGGKCYCTAPTQPIPVATQIIRAI
jgi:hypothetical protein